MKPSNIGGQAVMEGIMMRHKDKYSIAVRRPDKEIEVKVEDYKCIFGKARIWRKPIIRGMVSFIDSLVTGTKCLMYSAEIAGDEEDEEETRKNAALSPEELKAKKKKEDKAFKALLYVTVAVSIVISVAAFMLLPYALASLCRKVGASEVVVTIVEAFVKLGLFMGYMILISRMKDIQRTFMYHGAEHKCINCVENGKPLTVENVLESSRFHRRCGTSFLFLVMIVSIFLHFIFVLVPFYWLRLFGRLLMVPVVSGISFEIIQWAGRTDSKFALMMSKPGMAMQKFTTKEPTADMAEVAIKAVEAVFDWRAYLKTEFNLDIPYENKENGDLSAASAQSESGDSEERTGNVPLEALVFEYASLRGHLNGMNTKVITEIADYISKETGYEIPPMTPFVGENFNLTRAGIHADGMLKNHEIYNIFDTDTLLDRPPKVSVNSTSGIAGVGYWINQYRKKKGMSPVDKKSPLVRRVYDWVQEQYDEGRITIISDAELTRQTELAMEAE